MTSDIIILLFFTGLFAGFVDSIAGGGGLIALPVLLSIGLPPHIALGTNKLQSSFGTLFASYNYIRKGVVGIKENFIGIIFTLLGAAAGAWAVQQMESTIIKHLVPVLLFAVLIYSFFFKVPDESSRRARMRKNLFFPIFGIILGFYDGFFGPGTGSFWTALILVFLGHNLLKATGCTKIMNITSNIVSLVIFIYGNNVLYSAGILMAGGQIIGAYIGSNLAIKKGSGFIRPIFIAVVFATLVRLIYLNYAA